MRLLLVLSLMGLVLPGCALMRIGPAVEAQEVNEAEHAEKNMDALRALQADRYRRAPVVIEPPSQSKVHSTQPSDPSVDAFPAAIEQSRSHDFRTLLPSPSRAQPDLSSPEVRSQLSLTSPSAAHPAMPDRSVPAYTIPAPVPPNQGSTARCVPDGLGGQRCLAH